MIVIQDARYRGSQTVVCVMVRLDISGCLNKSSLKLVKKNLIKMLILQLLEMQKISLLFLMYSLHILCIAV